MCGEVTTMTTIKQESEDEVQCPNDQVEESPDQVEESNNESEDGDTENLVDRIGELPEDLRNKCIEQVSALIQKFEKTSRKRSRVAEILERMSDLGDELLETVQSSDGDDVIQKMLAEAVDNMSKRLKV